VPINRLSEKMIAGDRAIQLPADVLYRMGIKDAMVTVKLCLSADGVPTSLRVLQSSGYRPVDDGVLNKMRSWRFDLSSYGKPVCTDVMFGY
jgi:TonB family protein